MKIIKVLPVPSISQVGKNNHNISCIFGNRSPHFESFRGKDRFECRLKDLDSKKAQHTVVFEHFFESRSVIFSIVVA